MKIAIVGLGLIGGSFAKAIKSRTDHQVFGYDINAKTIQKVLTSKNIDKSILPADLSLADLTIIALYPQTTVDFIKENVEYFQPNSIVMDICGVKEFITESVHSLLMKHHIRYVPTHPMAGREFSGFDYAEANLFANASMVITPLPETDRKAVHTVRNLSNVLGFGRVVESTPQIHDDIIAFTSQLAHIVSNAYIKSPTAQMESGFSAGSFQDLTRVAKLDENMWASLFLLNQKPLLQELNRLIAFLGQYRKALADKDEDCMRELLKEGRILKEKSLRIK